MQIFQDIDYQIHNLLCKGSNCKMENLSLYNPHPLDTIRRFRLLYYKTALIQTCQDTKYLPYTLTNIPKSCKRVLMELYNACLANIQHNFHHDKPAALRFSPSIAKVTCMLSDIHSNCKKVLSLDNPYPLYTQHSSQNYKTYSQLTLHCIVSPTCMYSNTHSYCRTESPQYNPHQSHI